MNFKDVVNNLREGKKVRRRVWTKDSCLLLNENEVKFFRREAIRFNFDNSILLSNDWVLCDDEENKIEFAEAILYLLENKCVRLSEWPKTTYLKMEMSKKDFYMSKLCEIDSSLNSEDLLAADWETINE